MTEVQTIRWLDRALVLIDQRRLPGAEEYVTCRTSAEVADAIATMVVRGAPAIGVAAAYGMTLAAQAGEALDEAARRLKAARPTAVNLAWAVDRMVAEGATEEAAKRIHAEDVSYCAAIGEHGLVAFPKTGGRALTHCNTGALATAGIGTALGMIRSAHRAGRLERVYADETRPWLQGARLTAWECLRDGIPCTLLADSAAATVLSGGGGDVVVGGADRIAANGDAANKIGTYPLAVLAHRHGVPFYVAAPTSTLDLSAPTGDAIDIEQRPPSEVTHVAGVPVAPEGVEAFNPSFDVTPADLIAGIVTERGVARPPYVPSLAALLAG